MGFARIVSKVKYNGFASGESTLSSIGERNGIGSLVDISVQDTEAYEKV
jgi:hypothetical protein